MNRENVKRSVFSFSLRTDSDIFASISWCGPFALTGYRVRVFLTQLSVFVFCQQKVSCWPETFLSLIFVYVQLRLFRKYFESMKV